jgi:hypothetical protein
LQIYGGGGGDPSWFKFFGKLLYGNKQRRDLYKMVSTVMSFSILFSPIIGDVHMERHQQQFHTAISAWTY